MLSKGRAGPGPGDYLLIAKLLSSETPAGYAGGVSAKADSESLPVRRIVLGSVMVVVAAAGSGLGVWQLGRRADRRAANAVAASGHRLPVLDARSGRIGLLPNRRAVLVGELDTLREFVLRNRLVRGVPAVQIITPLRIPGYDSAVLVNRGYVPAADAVDPGNAGWQEASPGTFQGVLLLAPARGDGAPLRHNGKETWRGIDIPAMRDRLPYPLASVYLVAQEDSTEGTAHTVRGRVYPFRAELPPMDDGPHLMYAVQWFGIAIAVLAFGWLFVLRRSNSER